MNPKLFAGSGQGLRIRPTPPQLAPDRQPLVSSCERQAMSETENKPSLRIKGRLMSASEIERTLVRLAHEIVEKGNGSEDLALVGIKRRGIPLAERLGRSGGAQGARG